MKNLLTLTRPNTLFRRDESACHTFTNVIKLPSEDSGMSHLIVRFANNHIGKKKIPRRSAVVIKNTANRKWTIRYAMGNGGTIKGLDKSSIAFDYDAIHDLGVKYEQTVEISVKKATLLQCMMWLVNSSDLNVRLSFRFALLGAVLGIVSLLTALPSLLSL